MPRDVPPIPPRLRVAMVTPRFAPLVGGVETHVLEVSRRLAERGVAVTVLTIDETGAMPSSQTLHGVRVRRHRANTRGGVSTALRRDLLDLADEVDVVHVQGVHTALPVLALDAARRANLPTVLTFHTGGHSSRMRSAVRGLQWRTLRPALRRVDRLVAVCEYEVGYFSRRTGVPLTRFALIRNGATPLPVDADPGALPAGDPLIVCVARLERYKGQHRLVAAMPELLGRAPGARLVLVGAGPYASTLRGQIRELGIGRNVEIVAFAPHERGRLGALLRRADVSVLLSDYEAHPVAVMEAVALGVPTLVATGSGLTELVASGLVDGIDRTASPDEIATAVLDCASRGRRDYRDVQLPTWDDTVDTLVDLYSGMLAAPAAGRPLVGPAR